MPQNGRMAVQVLALAATLGCQVPDAFASTPTSPAESELFAAGLVDFLAWAHPTDQACRPVERIEVLARWPGGLRVRYEVPCNDERRLFQALLRTREGGGVWQVAGGFETGEAEFQAAVKARILRIPRESMEGVEVSPPPDNAGGGRESPLDAVLPPVPRRQPSPEYPEEAGRARLIGAAHVELLVDVTPKGTAAKARPLRGPDPDLGMRQSALQAVMRWGFAPARLADRPVRYFAPIEITFDGLPPESRSWSHRALYDLEALVYDDRPAAEAAGRRLRAGEPIEEVAPLSALDSEWGLVPAAGLPAPLRKALHDTPLGLWAGPVAGDGSEYLARKRGEVYYGILPSGGATLQYQVVHQRGIPDGDELRRTIDEDILDFMAERQRRDYMNEAARLMGLRQARARIGQLIIHTDVLEEEEINLLGQIVGAAFRAHQEFWASLTTLRLFRQPVLVYAFARRSDHQKVQEEWHGRRALAPPSSVGEYIPASRILAFPCEATAGHLPVPIVIHESIHMLNYERVYGPRVTPSKWFEEGLANYFGYSQVDGRLQIDPGAIRRSGTIAVGKVRVQFDPRSELREHLRRMRAEGPVPLQRLIGATADDPLWTSGDSGRTYGAAWTLVHFLIHGDHGRHAPAFREYAAREARGEGGAAAFGLLFGPDLSALESAWHGYEETL